MHTLLCELTHKMALKSQNTTIKKEHKISNSVKKSDATKNRKQITHIDNTYTYVETFTVSSELSSIIVEIIWSQITIETIYCKDDIFFVV